MRKNILSKNTDQTGSILVSILIVSIFIVTILLALIQLANSNLILARKRIISLQAQYSAETGADVAIAKLNSGDLTYSGQASELQVISTSLYRSTFTSSVVAGVDGKEKKVSVTGKVYFPPSSTTAKYERKIEVIAQRSSTTTTSSMLSRNIIEIDSGVKNIIGRDVYVNGYINMNKNNTNLIAENITVADKNTGASNCSIGGTGNLIKPTSFSHAGQTKTNLILSFNNCITPPGNSSNTDFNVLANQSNISKIQSTNIPWSQYMDSSYNNFNNCNDWTSGTFPRDIPSTGNAKKTHYPDSGSNISTSCGTNGDITLGNGQYNLKDHAHIRANLCATSGCTPTFYNPDATIKFLFVEGSINFSSLQTASGSGPIVIVAYGADPASKTSVCPYGGSIYLGNSGTTNAKAVYFIAMNGICLDKTKFGSDPALGGISGKNIYVATNPGTPHDLRLDVTFPVDQIPVDLAWRSARYRRL